MKKFTILLLLMCLLASAGAFAQNATPGQLKTTRQEANNSTEMLLANDVGVISILTPISGYNLSRDLVRIRVKNFGTSVQSNILVSYSVNGATPVTGMIKGPLGSDETFDYVFPGFVYLGNPGQGCSINACTTLEGDEFIGNDCLTNTIWNMSLYYCDCSSIIEDEYIANVLFGMINSSSGWQGGVADYTDQFTVLASGESEAITITNGNAWASDFVYVWVDWDQDYDLCTNLALEQYILTNVGGTGEIFTGNISVPVGQARGNYRMRIRMTYSTPPVPGGSATYGEVEDYTLVVFNVTDPGIVVSPVILSQILSPDQNAIKEVKVANVGAIPLNFDITLNVLNKDVFNEIQNVFYQPAITTAAILNESEPGNISLKNNPDVFEYSGGRSIIRYDNGDNAGAFGIAGGGTYEISAYFPATTMAQHAGKKLKTVEFYINGTPISCKVKVYGPGTPTSPGTLLHEETSFAYNLNWTGLLLSPPVNITGEDLWIGYEITHAPGVLPSSYDSGPATAGFGDLIKIDGEWTTLANFDLNNNWNLKGEVSTGEPVPAKDVGVVSLISPVTGANLGDEVVKIRVKNMGIDPQSNIPVSYSIYGGDTISEIIPNTLVSGATVDFTFPGTVNLGQSGQALIIKTFTTLPGDGNVSNDGKTVFVANLVSQCCGALTFTEEEYISNVLFGDINNSSGWQSLLADFTNLSTTIEAGASENITVTNGLPYTNDLVTAWVDWNKDFDFNAADEQYVLTNQNGAGETFTGEISVPQNQPTGNYRLRIRMCYFTEPVPCGGSTYGEIEEYSIHVANNQTITWLTVEPMMGAVNPNDSVAVNVTFNSAGLPFGIYNGSIIFTSNDPVQPFTTIPVTLIVSQCPLPPPLNIEGYEILPNVAYLSWQVPEPSGDLLGYNIYRNNQKINPDIVSNLFYEDSLTNPSQYFYHITAVYPECEASSDTISLVITNLPEKENRGITISPNPATNFVNIKSQYSINQISIINNFGQVVFSGDFESNSVQVNTSDFNKGIYFIRIETEMGVVSDKFVVQ